jgi:hypothetical protein
MNKPKAIMIAVAGASLLVASQAQASNSFGYSADDLVLNFRDTANLTGNDLEINLGPISVISALTSEETVVAGGAGGLLQTVYSTALSGGTIGFSADAADTSGTTGTIWLTRAESAPNIQGANPLQVPYSNATAVNNKINNIGAGANGGTIVSQGVAEVVGATSGNSYQAQAEAGTSAANQAKITFGGYISLLPANGGPIESIQTGSGPVYEALWEQPTSDGANPGFGTSLGPDVYLGYFTFNPNGEVDYTPASVPEPSTYVLFGLTGLLGLAFRRQIRSVFA